MTTQPVTMQLPLATGGTINLVYEDGYWRLADDMGSSQLARLYREFQQAYAENQALRRQFTYLRETAISLTQANYNMLRSSCARSFQ